MVEVDADRFGDAARMRTILAACAVVALLVPSTADARRRPSRAEKAAIVAGFEKRSMHSDLSCYAVSVSTVNPRWASLTFHGLRSDENLDEYIERCPGAANGLAMMHRHGKKTWKYDADAGSYRDRCPVKPVPTRVAVDLRACTRD